MRRFLRFLNLPLREQVTTLHAWLTLVVVELLIRWMRLPRLATLTGVTLEAIEEQPSSSSARVRLSEKPDGDHPAARSEMIGRAVRSTRRVMRRWPFGKGTCLRESLVLGHLLREHSPLLRIGIVSRDKGLLAHAWLEVDGEAFGESRGFTVFRLNRSAL
jgi:hypothetical protein